MENVKNRIGSALATEKQKEFLARLGVDAEPGLTKDTASELIDEALENVSEDRGLSDVRQNIPMPWYAGTW